ncbi:RNA-binding protein [Pullulanibacillus camelliae]|uniref:RNA-binding protein n=1 Tax=Pullulanibacillus camelliae TaxID=1707096 RepID=A0A8J2YFK5_9BACL|nr:CGNR zinc finger domain-containing protein [Pullulanibacillus camelliae]GGE32814.1 RNA-binding protein [Pullulanibacillus camelliae]
MTKQTTFPLISGHPSLDLVNTEIVRRGKRHDLLVSEKEMQAWLEDMRNNSPYWYWNDTLSKEIEMRGVKILDTLLAMRVILRKNFEDIAEQRVITKDFISFLEAVIEKAPLTYKVIDNKLLPIPVGEIEDGLASLVALDVLTLMEDSKLRALKRCANPDCVLLFIDETGRRKWCSMKICGNRKKAQVHQQRKSR